MVLRLAYFIAVAAAAEAKSRKQISENAENAPYFVKCSQARYQIVGFETLGDAREYAMSLKNSEGIIWDAQGDDVEAKIYEKGGKHIETYRCGIPESEYADIVVQDKSNEIKMTNLFQKRMHLITKNSFPYYVEYDHFGPKTGGTFTLEKAKEIAFEHTNGLYRLNGQLTERTAKIYEKGGKLIETYISGLTEAEYNEALAKQKNEKNDNKGPNATTHFSWNSANMR